MEGGAIYRTIRSSYDKSHFVSNTALEGGVLFDVLGEGTYSHTEWNGNESERGGLFI